VAAGTLVVVLYKGMQQLAIHPMGDVAEGLTTALDLQESPVNDLRAQIVQMVLTLKNTLVDGDEVVVSPFTAFLYFRICWGGGGKRKPAKQLPRQGLRLEFLPCV
jgi:hypothetical protein